MYQGLPGVLARKVNAQPSQQTLTALLDILVVIFWKLSLYVCVERVQTLVVNHMGHFPQDMENEVGEIFNNNKNSRTKNKSMFRLQGT